MLCQNSDEKDRKRSFILETIINLLLVKVKKKKKQQIWLGIPAQSQKLTLHLCKKISLRVSTATATLLTFQKNQIKVVHLQNSKRQRAQVQTNKFKVSCLSCKPTCLLPFLPLKAQGCVSAHTRLWSASSSMSVKSTEFICTFLTEAWCIIQAYFSRQSLFYTPVSSLFHSGLFIMLLYGAHTATDQLQKNP